MKLADEKVSSFVDILASDAPAPGGGSTAALEGALGAALTAMVCSLTIGRKKYADYQGLASETQIRAEKIKMSFLDVMERDTESFNLVSNAFGMPKNSDEEKQARSQAIQAGLEACTKTPLEMMELAANALELIDSILGKCNENAASDLGVSALSLRSAIQGAWLNVLINIGSLKDKEKAEHYRLKGQELLDRALPLTDKIYNYILKSM